MRFLNYYIGAFLLLAMPSFAQQTIKEQDFSYTYKNSKIAIDFTTAAPTAVTAFDAITEQPIEVVKEATSYVLQNLKPAEIIRLEYGFGTAKAALQRSYLANLSASTGAINVYFNHTVDVTYSQGQNAVNLGNTLDDMLVTYINACTTTLDIAIYNSYSPSSTTGIVGAINAAYDRGVQVRLIYDGSTSSAMIPLLNPAIPILASPTSSSYGIMHNKFVLFDAAVTDASKPIVWTGSTNWTVAQIDGPDTNSVITIQDQALALGYKIEFEEMWGSNTLTPNTTTSKFGPYKIDNTPHHYVIGGKTIDSYFSPSDGVNAKIIATINTANTDIDVATMLITRSDISSALIAKYNAGVNVNVVIDSQNPSGNQISVLQSGLAPSHAVVFNGSGIMHHKFMVVDNYNSASDPLVLLGSHNWSSSAETKNDENTLIVHDATIANLYYQAFIYLYQQYGGVLSVSSHEVTPTALVVAPNPTSGWLSFMNTTTEPMDHVKVMVYDVLGAVLLEKDFDAFTTAAIDLSAQAHGVYFVTATLGGNTMHYKVVKE